MNNWKVHALTSSLKGLLPFQNTLRFLTRKLKPYATAPENDIGLLGDALRQIDALRRMGRPLAGATVVEIGTGWKPILPILFRLCGATKIITVDQERLLDLGQFQAALRYIRDNIDRVSNKLSIFVDLSFEQISIDDGSLAKTLADSCIEYRAPFNFTRLPSRCADIIVSRTVLEHVPEALLQEMMQESRRILVPDGVICHTIDMSDHWEHIDKSISRVNFLQYDGLAWTLAGTNPQNFQNRLRRFEYIECMGHNGFEVISVTGDPNPAAVEALKTLPLCKRYNGVPHEELAILNATIIARCRPN